MTRRHGVTWYARLVLAGAALVLAAPGWPQTSDPSTSILGLTLGAEAADVAVAQALREPGRGPSDADRAGHLFELAQSLEERRDDLALVLHRVIVERYSRAEMPSGIEGTLYAEESRARIAWLTGDRSWLASSFRELYRGLAAALVSRDAAAIAALAPPHVRVGPYRACPDGWRPRAEVARELARTGATPGPLELEGADHACFRLTVANEPRGIVMRLARGRAEWQAYCYEENP